MTCSDDSPKPWAQLTEFLHGAMPLAATSGIEAMVADDRRPPWLPGLPE